MSSADTSHEIAVFAQRLGAPPIRALFEWVDAQVEYGMGVEIEWRGQQKVRGSLLAQYPKLERLRNTILQTGESKEEEFTVTGMLEAADVTSKSFKIRPEGAEEIRGKFSDAISLEHTVELPRRYTAVLRKMTQVQYALEEEQVSYFLLELRSDR